MKERVIDHSGICKHSCGSTHIHTDLLPGLDITHCLHSSLLPRTPLFLQLEKSCQVCFHCYILLCLLTFLCHQSLLTALSLSVGMCVLPVCVCVSVLGLKFFNGEDEITVYSDHCSRLSLKAGFYTYSRHERAVPLAELNTSDMPSFFWDTSKFPQLSHHLWVLGS